MLYARNLCGERSCTRKNKPRALFRMLRAKLNLWVLKSNKSSVAKMETLATYWTAFAGVCGTTSGKSAVDTTKMYKRLRTLTYTSLAHQSVKASMVVSLPNNSLPNMVQTFTSTKDGRSFGVSLHPTMPIGKRDTQTGYLVVNSSSLPQCHSDMTTSKTNSAHVAGLISM